MQKQNHNNTFEYSNNQEGSIFYPLKNSEVVRPDFQLDTVSHLQTYLFSIVALEIELHHQLVSSGISKCLVLTPNKTSGCLFCEEKLCCDSRQYKFSATTSFICDGRPDNDVVSVLKPRLSIAAPIDDALLCRLNPIS
jgi:hypothetical protein